VKEGHAQTPPNVSRTHSNSVLCLCMCACVSLYFCVSVFVSVCLCVHVSSIFLPVCVCVRVCVSVRECVCCVPLCTPQGNDTVFTSPKTCLHVCAYGVATISRLLEIIGLFCRISSLL